MVELNRNATPAEISNLFETGHRHSTSFNNKKTTKVVQKIMAGVRADSQVGIKSEEISDRRTIFGSNAPKPPPEKKFMSFLCTQFKDFCVQVLFFSAIIVFVIGFYSENKSETWLQSITITIALVFVVALGSFTDYQKEKQFLKFFTNMTKKAVKVIRDNTQQTITTDELVVGDLIIISSGLMVDVDMILIEGSFLEVDESSVTGVSGNKMKSACCNEGTSCDPFIISGSNVIDGSGMAVVCCVGLFSKAGKLNSAEEDHKHSDQLNLSAGKSLGELAKFMIIIGCFFGLSMFLVLTTYAARDASLKKQSFWSRKSLENVLDDFIDSLLVVILSVPEGLPLVLTISLINSLHILRKDHRVMARKLDSSYMMGGTNLICFDKTGTLTKNNLKITQFCFQSNFYNESYGTSDLPNRRFLDRIAEIFALTSGVLTLEKTDLEPEVGVQNKLGSLGGKVIDRTILELLIKTRRTFDFTSKHQKALKKISLNQTQNLFQCLIVYDEDSKTVTIYLKGNTNYLLERCTKMIIEGREECIEMSLEDKCRIRNHIQQTKQTSKSLTMAYKTFTDINSIEEALKIMDFEDLDSLIIEMNELILVTIFILQDESKESIIETLTTMRRIGIRPIVATGDGLEASISFCVLSQILTAEQATISNSKIHEIVSPFILTGKELRDRVARLSANILHDLPDYQVNLLQNEVLNANHIEEQESTSPLVRQALKEEDRQAQLETSLIKFPNNNLSPLHLLVQNLTLLVQATDKDKAMLVLILKKIGNIVSYVGDGNNDAPALKAAHVGISMGVSGTNIAKESSSLILINDELNKIITCVGWGRNIVENIQRFIYFQLTVYIVSIYMMIVSSIALAEPPFSILQIIWLTLIQDIFSSIGLALEKPSEDILQKKPLKQDEKLINGYLIKLILAESIYQITVLTLFLFFIPQVLGIPNSSGISKTVSEIPFEENKAVHYTILFNSMVFLQIFNLINARRLQHSESNPFTDFHKNKFLLFDLIFIIIAQISIVEFGGQVFKCGRLTLFQFFLSTLCGIFNIPVFYFIKKGISHWCECCDKNVETDFLNEEEQSILLKKE